MSVIIRLQGLPWSANALDIRRFFQNLNIPEGGVHIVGGELGDAFIAFSTDEDARQAMQMDNGKIKDSTRLKLFLSSRVEMQKVIEAARNRNVAMQASVVPPNNPNLSAANAGVMGLMGNTASSSVGGQLNNLTSPFDIQTQVVQPQQPPQQSQLVYVNRLALEQQQPNLMAQKQIIDYSSGILPANNAPNTPFGGPKMDQSREKDVGRGSDRGGRDYDRDRDRSRERDKDRSKGRSRRRDRSRSPRKSRDRGGDDGFRRRSNSREDDRERRGNSNRFRDLDSRQEMSNNMETNNGGIERFNDPPQSSRRGPSRWNRENSPVQNLPKRDVEQRMSGSGNMPQGAQTAEGQDIWDKSGGGTARSSMMGEQSFSGFGGQQLQRNLSPPRGTLVMVRGVPFNAMPVHIRDFFTGLTIGQDGIHFANDARGERLPVVFVRFASERDRDLALRRPKQYLNNCIVEVMPTTEDEMRATLDVSGGGLTSPPNRPSESKSGNMSSVNNRNCVVLQGIPPMIREGDVVRFLDGFNLKDVFIKYDGMGKPSGLCFVELSDPREAERCLEMNGQMMGPRHIEISLISKEEMTMEKTGSRGPSGGGGGGGQFGNNGGLPRHAQGGGGGFNDREIDVRDSDCCLVRGLPFNAENRDVYEFFAPSGCTPVAIHLMKDSNDRALGDAVCEFANSRQCNIALQQDGAPIRHGARVFLMVRPISRRELEDSIKTTSGSNQNSNFSRSGPNPNQQRSNDYKLGLLGPMPDGRFPGPFQGGPNFNNGPRFNGPGMMMDSDNRGMMDNGPPSRSGGGRRMSSPPMSPQHMQFNRSQGPPGKFGRPGTVIEVTNIPYRANVDDIVDFFQGFPVSTGDVIRKYNNRGQPTGDARVVFPSPEDAQTAIRRLDKKSIMGRTISLTVL